MLRSAWLALLIVLVVPSLAAARDVVPGGWRAGINLTAWSPDGYEAAGDALAAARATGATDVSLVPTLYVSDATDSSVAPDPARTPTDDSLRQAARQARALGMTVTIKPHVDADDGTYRGELAPADHAAWFAGYDRWLLHYAALAEETGARTLVIGTELDSMVADRAQFERLIAAVRRVYDGELTYASNWDTVGDVGFWDALDVIGVDAYVPLGDASSTPEELRAAWVPFQQRLAALHEQTGKRVVFTELGYPSRSDGLARPFDARGPADESVQARGYEAAFAVWAGVPWLEGISWWDWTADPNAVDPDPGAYSPHGKQAEAVLTRWTRGSATPAAVGGAGPGPVVLVWTGALLLLTMIAACALVVRRRRPPAPEAVPVSAAPWPPADPAAAEPLPSPAAAPTPSPATASAAAAPTASPAAAPVAPAPTAEPATADPSPALDPVTTRLRSAGADALLARARMTLDATGIELLLRDPVDPRRAHSVLGLGLAEQLGPDRSSDAGLLGHVLSTGNAIAVADCREVPGEPLGAIAALAVPVHSRGRLVGALAVSRSERFAPSERHLLAPFAESIGALLPHRPAPREPAPAADADSDPAARLVRA